MREVNGSDLLLGTDHEFVVNLYTVILNRWPDEDGYRHHLDRVENHPGLRRQVIEEFAASAEASTLGVVVTFTDDPAPVAAVAQPSLAALLAGLGAMPDADLHALQRHLAEALTTVAAERAARLEARLARLEQRLA